MLTERLDRLVSMKLGDSTFGSTSHPSAWTVQLKEVHERSQTWNDGIDKRALFNQLDAYLEFEEQQSVSHAALPRRSRPFTLTARAASSIEGGHRVVQV